MWPGLEEFWGVRVVVYNSSLIISRNSEDVYSGRLILTSTSQIHTHIIYTVIFSVQSDGKMITEELRMLVFVQLS
jgi:hypothetical protein